LNHRSIVMLVMLLLFGILQAVPTSAQQVPPGWADPQTVNADCCAALDVPVVDPWGNLHVFWADSATGAIMYSRLDGEGWLPAIDIIAGTGNRGTYAVDATFTRDGYLHVVWIAGAGGQLLYSRAWVADAGAAPAWQSAVVIAERAMGTRIKADSSGLLHVVYSPFEAGLGVVHATSPDGAFWSKPDVAESGLTSNWTGEKVRLSIDADDTLHVAWNSLTFPGGYPEHAVYYQRSTDGGQTWSAPFDPDPLPPDIDANIESGFKNKMINVAAAPDGAIHLTWHQHTGYRWHRMSTDGGLTWGPSETIFPDMGPAYNGIVDMAFDSAGDLHVVATRNSVWTRTWVSERGWLPPELIDSRTPDWHHQRAAVLDGNRLFLFYPDINGTGLLWVTSRSLDAPAIAPTLLPERPTLPSLESQVRATALPTTAATPTSAAFPAQESTSSTAIPQSTAILVGLVPAVTLVAVVVIIRMARRRH